MVTIDAPDTDAADALADLWVDLARGQRDHGSHLLTEANRSRVREAVVRHIVTGGLLVARREGELVGFVMFSPETDRYEQDVDRGVIHNIYVSRDHRCEGIGTELLTAAETAFRDRGVDIVALEVMADNDDARRFYRDRGYDPHRIEMEAPLDGPERDTERDTERATDPDTGRDTESDTP